MLSKQAQETLPNELTVSGDYYYWPKGLRGQLSTHLDTLEFDCSCNYSDCTRSCVAVDLVVKLETLRQRLGSPLKVTSGFRCKAYQKKLGESGAQTAVGISQHELGKAADVAARKMDDLTKFCKEMFKAVGTAKTFVHVDLRSDKQRSWTY